MSRYLLLFLLAVGIFVVARKSCTMNGFNILAEQGKGPIKSETRTLEAFSGIESNLPADITVERSDEHRIEISMQENLLPYFEDRVQGGTLHLKFSRQVNTNKPVAVRVYTDEVSEIKINGAGDVKVQSAFGGKNLDIRISGVSDVYFPQATYEKIGCRVSGSGSINLGGSADNLEAELTGVGKVQAADLQVKSCSARVSGSGNINCSVSDDLKADVSGVGNIRYKGQPRVESKISGAGSVEPAN